MFSALSPGNVGIQAKSLDAAILAAQQGGFAGLELSIQQVADLIDQQGVEAVTGALSAAGLRVAGWGLPIDWRNSEAAWHEGLAALPRLAKAAQAVGATRVCTWIMPCSNERDYAENRAFHIERLKPVAQILAEHGQNFGLEFVGPKTLRDTQRYPFIYTMEGMLAMGEEIGPNVGLLLDCFHWFTSHGTIAELEALRPEQVVYVHINDAQAGLSADEQIDNRRALPGETGVIDINGFLKALDKIGYDGPIVCEPFKKELSELASDAERSKVVGDAIRKVLAQAGIREA
jgi:Sugar phosphate isomerases/epimerases